MAVAGIGAIAQRLLVDELFTETETNRVEADTDVANLAEQRALERAGFTREGMIRGTRVAEVHVEPGLRGSESMPEPTYLEMK